MHIICLDSALLSLSAVHVSEELANMRMKATGKVEVGEMGGVVEAGGHLHGCRLLQAFSFPLPGHKGDWGIVCYEDADHGVAQQEPCEDVQLLVSAKEPFKAPLDPGLQLHVRAFVQTIPMLRAFARLGLKSSHDNGSNIGDESRAVCLPIHHLHLVPSMHPANW